MNNTILFAVGSYTAAAPHVPDAAGKGISILALNERSGEISLKQSIKGILNPSYLDWNRSTGLLYALSEDPNSEGVICGYKKGSGNLFELQYTLPGPGEAGCHISSDQRGEYLWAASYGKGTVRSYKLAPSPQVLSEITYSGTGPNLSRQDSSHAHQVLPDPENKRIYICDLGSDSVWMHSLTETLSHKVKALAVPGGYGPRHMAFDYNGKYAFLLCELKPRLLVLAIDSVSGQLKIVDDLPVGRGHYSGPSAPAAVKLHPSGRALILSNRFADEVEVFSILRKNGAVKLRFQSSFPSGGKTPRDFAFSPSGKWMLIANQDSHNIEIKLFDCDSGLPVPGDELSYQSGSPVCLTPLL